MGDQSKIEWTDASWNPVTGCSHVSPGCEHCYAEAFSRRMGWTRLPWGAQHAAENVHLHADRLEQPLRWRRPRRIFVNSMSDLFHEMVPDEFVVRVFDVMRECHNNRGHVFQVLTKRPARMLDVCTRLRFDDADGGRGTYLAGSAEDGGYRLIGGRGCSGIRNVWLGVSVEDQRRADERIPLLLQCPAAVRWISAEPLLGPVDLARHLWAGGDDGEPAPRNEPNTPRLSWIVVGGESGPGARPMHPQWARDLRDQCQAVAVPFFFKQWGEWIPAADAYNVGLLRMGRTYPAHRWEDESTSFRVGKKAAGRRLDCRIWGEYPQAREMAVVAR